MHKLTRMGWFFLGGLTLLVLALPPGAYAQQTWQAAVGAESPNMGRQASAFLPNEIWIHAGDSITWTFHSDEIHTLTFLTPGQIFPPAAPIPAPAFVVGCPGFATSPATYDGSTCVTTPTLVKGATFTVTFPKAGVFKINCLVHNSMTGTVYVVPANKLLPHDQAFYNREAASQAQALLADAGDSMSRRMQGNGDRDGDHDGDDGMTALLLPGNKQVVAGVGEVSLTPGGMQTGSVLRFLQGTVVIHAGDTVEWGNHDPIEPHTITFGPEPSAATQAVPSASGNASLTKDPDGILHATITKATGFQVNSGFIVQALEDESHVPQNTLARNPTRFRVTFSVAGTYPYICVLHDNLGMVGKVIVLP